MTTTAADTDRRAELLARLLRKRRQEQQENDQITAGPATLTATASSQQHGLWLAGELNPRSSDYNMITVLRLRGPLDIRLLRAAVSGLIARHEGLRTSFVERDGSLRLVIEPPPGRFWIEPMDLSAVPESSRSQRVVQLISDCCRQRIELRRAPLLRVYLARLATEDYLLGYVLHHIISDGWSMQILAAELSEFYCAAAEGRPARLPAHTIQPSDVYRWQRERLGTEAVQRRLNGWRDQLSGMPPLRFPLDRSRPAVPNGAGSTVTVQLPTELIVRADELAAATDRTPFSVLIAAFAVLVQQRTGQYDLAIGTVFSGRVRTEMESLIGYFANTSVLRIRTADDQPIGELIRHCHDVVLDAQRMQDVPFPDVVNAVAPARQPGTNPLFQICFTLSRSGVTIAAPAFESVDAQLLDVDVRGSRFDLTFQVIEQADGGFVLKLEYVAELFDESTMLRLATDYRNLLRAMVAGNDGGSLTLSRLQRAVDLSIPAPTPTTIRERVTPSATNTGTSEPGPTADTTLRNELARIWAEVLDTADDPRDDQNFFEVGGTSLTAVRLRARIVSQFGVDIPLADIFAGGSIAELLPSIEAELVGGPAALTGPVGGSSA